MNLLFVGHVGSGKTASCYTICGDDDWSDQSTKEAKLLTGELRGRNVMIVDTPGVDGLDINQHAVGEIANAFSLVPGGFTSIVVVIRIERLSQQIEHGIRLLRDIFGYEACKFMCVVFTYGDHLRQRRNKGMTIADFVCSITGKELNNFIKACDNRYVAFDNMQDVNSTTSLEQVNNFIKMVEEIKTNNDATVYTKEMMKQTKQSMKSADGGSITQKQIQERSQYLKPESKLDEQSSKYMPTEYRRRPLRPINGVVLQCFKYFLVVAIAVFTVQILWFGQ